MSSQPEITQRDLRMKSKEIMDAVERGQAFTVTRDGHRIGELVPLRQHRRFNDEEDGGNDERGFDEEPDYRRDNQECEQYTGHGHGME